MFNLKRSAQTNSYTRRNTSSSCGQHDRSEQKQGSGLWFRNTFSVGGGDHPPKGAIDTAISDHDGNQDEQIYNFPCTKSH